MRLDLSDLAIVKYFSMMVANQFPHVHILVNNAGYSGYMFEKEKPTKQGFESHFGVMHMGHFALTEWIIQHNEGPVEDLTVVNVASGEIDCLPFFLFVSKYTLLRYYTLF